MTHEPKQKLTSRPARSTREPLPAQPKSSWWKGLGRGGSERSRGSSRDGGFWDGMGLDFGGGGGWGGGDGGGGGGDGGC